MKRMKTRFFALALALIIVFILSACADRDNNNSSGGNGASTPPASSSGNTTTPPGNNNAGDDNPDMSLPKIEAENEWPTAYLPKDFPAYTEGAFTVEAEPGKVYILYTNTTYDSFMSYIYSLKDNGWTIDEIDETTGSGTSKSGKWLVQYVSETGDAFRILSVYAAYYVD